MIAVKSATAIAAIHKLVFAVAKAFAVWPRIAEIVSGDTAGGTGGRGSVEMAEVEPTILPLEAIAGEQAAKAIARKWRVLCI